MEWTVVALQETGGVESRNRACGVLAQRGHRKRLRDGPADTPGRGVRAPPALVGRAWWRAGKCVWGEERGAGGPARQEPPAGGAAGPAARAARRCEDTAAAPRWSSDAVTFHSPGETRPPPGCRGVPPCRLAWACPSVYIKE